MSSCTLKVKKIHPDVSQMRLDFIHFNLGQPNRRTGICEDDIFLLSGGSNSKNLTICGTNDDQHIYFDVDSVEQPITITMNLSDKVISRLWEIRIVQIPFNDRVPEGCLQYHTGLNGIVKTMNFAENGRHLANQNYNICLRQEKGTCSVVYEPCHKNSFKIGPGQNNTSGVNGDAFSDVGSGDGAIATREDDSCNDRVVVPCPFEDLIMPGNVGVGFCDLSLCGSFSCPSGEADCKVETNVVPFRIGIHFGPVSREESPEDNLGVCLKYEQQLCTV
ncbi:uncharacterized protein LOC108736080 [Agrilus planipennis]|uniref:Uncharacterized protein LOC108736080 n=1 Tax=Agrilus planipennis TaxID=224129 RepID=A0A1W4WUZ1_AGRPL|nr:uncharacterized protein LOC108736080 [Agrilus planipennis]